LFVPSTTTLEAARVILYEYPFNERVRTLLRLEDLFARFAFFLAREDARDHHVALVTLFEIVEVAGRVDLKTDLMKELERQRQALTPLREVADVEQHALEAILGDIEQTLANLMQMQGKTGQYLMDNEWLSSVRNRVAVPGGTCRFDLPSYYAWQQFPVEQRRQDILRWMAPLLPLREATAIVLRLARESGKTTRVMATQGAYQQMLGGRTYQLMQVRIAPDLLLIPEASANKYMLWVRFTMQDGDQDQKPRAMDTADVPFQLTLCSL
jgi:cell division protein ZapD